jgi:hypothetical protein
MTRSVDNHKIPWFALINKTNRTVCLYKFLNYTRRKIMKSLALILVALFLAATLSACATSGPSSGAKVKCPACGHDFNYSESPEK